MIFYVVFQTGKAKAEARIEALRVAGGRCKMYCDPNDERVMQKNFHWHVTWWSI